MQNRRDVSMEGCVAKGLCSTGVRDAGELSSPASAQALSDVAAQTGHGQVVGLPLERASMSHQTAFSTGLAQGRWQEMFAK